MENLFILLPKMLLLRKELIMGVINFITNMLQQMKKEMFLFKDIAKHIMVPYIQSLLEEEKLIIEFFVRVLSLCHGPKKIFMNSS